MLRFRDILARIRTSDYWIRIRHRILLYSSLTFKTPTKQTFFCLLLFEGTFTSIFKNKKVIKKSQNIMNKGFSYYFCLMIEGCGSRAGWDPYLWLMDPDPGGRKHTDSADPDPQHYLQEYINTRKYCTVSANTVSKKDHSRIQIFFMLFNVLYMLFLRI
jgi:hypothetical protein